MSNDPITAAEAPPAPLLTVLMLTQPSRDKLRAAAWAALCEQVDVDNIEILVLADKGCDPATLPAGLGALPVPTWAKAPTVVDAWPTLTDKLNAGVKLATAPFITFWDDDDWAEPERIVKTLGAIQAIDADIYGPPAMLRHELLAPTRRTLVYTSPWDLPCLNGTVIRRDLLLRRPFEALHAPPTQHNVGAWLRARQQDGVDFATLDVVIVAMATGGLNAPRQYRVDPVNLRVQDGHEHAIVGARDAVAAIMGEPALARFEDATR